RRQGSSAGAPRPARGGRGRGGGCGYVAGRAGWVGISNGGGGGIIRPCIDHPCAGARLALGDKIFLHPQRLLHPLLAPRPLPPRIPPFSLFSGRTWRRPSSTPPGPPAEPA